jgi:rod shape-determining protein MreD
MNKAAGARLGEPASLWRMRFVPIATVMFASALPLMLPLVANSPVLPPLGLLFFLCWQLLRTEMWPVWIGLPLGLWDDLFSGQPIGTAVGLWTLASIAIHYSSQRIYWRGFFTTGRSRAVDCDHPVARGADRTPTCRHGSRPWAGGAADRHFGAAGPLFMRLTGTFDNFRLRRR